MEEISSCPLCKSTKKVFFEDIHDSGQQLKFLICRRCGLVYQSPRVDKIELEKFIEREYRIQRRESENPIEKDLLMQTDAEVYHFLSHVAVGAGAISIQAADQERLCQTDRLLGGVFIDAELIGDQAEGVARKLAQQRL